MVEIRRLDLISEAKRRKLSIAEAKELKAILKQEAYHSLASGDIGCLALIILLFIIDNLPFAKEYECSQESSKP